VVSTSNPTAAFSAFQTGPLLLYSSNYSVYPITRLSGPRLPLLFPANAHQLHTGTPGILQPCGRRKVSAPPPCLQQDRSCVKDFYIICERIQRVPWIGKSTVPPVSGRGCKENTLPQPRMKPRSPNHQPVTTPSRHATKPNN
jgi:hypothetical protein